GRALVSDATGGDCASGGAPGGAIVIPPCITDQATTAQAADCRRKAAENLRRTPKSWLKAALNLAAIDYTCPQQKDANGTAAMTVGSLYVKCRYRGPCALTLSPHADPLQD